MASLQAVKVASSKHSAVTAFICANCARAGVAPFSVRPRPGRIDFDWPLPVEEIVVPCTGRLQPEHLLKVFEAGASLVCVIACQDDNCHYVEGCRRAGKRLDYVRGLLDQIGLGGDRLALFQLPGSAREDLAAGADQPQPVQVSPAEMAQQIQTIREAVAAKMQVLAPNPFYKPQEIADEVSAVEETDDNED